VAAGSLADSSRTGDLDVSDDFWISFVVREDQLVPVGGSIILPAGDEIPALPIPNAARTWRRSAPPSRAPATPVPHRPDNWASVTAALGVSRVATTPP
jgi:hypothetical protein